MSLLELSRKRHSPRAFDGSALTWDDLAEAFEAARLSSSSYNNQPWRFVVALRGEAGFDVLQARSMNGQLVGAWTIQSQVQRIDVSEMAAGHYFMSVSGADGHTFSGSLVVSK